MPFFAPQHRSVSPAGYNPQQPNSMPFARRTISNPLQNAHEFIKGSSFNELTKKDKLYFTSIPFPVHENQYVSIHLFSIDQKLVYTHFYADFGPNHIGHVIRFCEIVGQKLREHPQKKICLYSSMDADKRTNAAFMMCAYMMLVFKMSPEEAYAPLNNISPPLLMYRDAGYGPATYHISVLDCLRGLHRGLSIGLLHLDTFDSEEYEFYEKVENGDMNWLCSKFLALASPKDVNPYAQYLQQGRNPIEQQQAFGLTTSSLMPQRTSRSGRHYSVANIPELIRYFKEKGVTTIIRLNNQLYDRQPFIDAGIEHIEMYFPDGTTPPENILVQFLNLCENTPGAIAVHCKAGLGRTGTLIAAYMMKHYKMTASEVISYLRVMRPGSVVGPQQNWLHSMQQTLWRLHPATPLSPIVSLLSPSTFAATKRFASHLVFLSNETVEATQKEHKSASRSSLRLKQRKEESGMDLDSESNLSSPAIYESQVQVASPVNERRFDFGPQVFANASYAIPIQPRKTIDAHTEEIPAMRPQTEGGNKAQEYINKFFPTVSGKPTHRRNISTALDMKGRKSNGSNETAQNMPRVSGQGYQRP